MFFFCVFSITVQRCRLTTYVTNGCSFFFPMVGEGPGGILEDSCSERLIYTLTVDNLDPIRQ